MARRAEFDHSAVEYRTAPATGDPVRGEGQWLHKTTAHLGGQQVGYLDWHPVNGKVHMIHTTPAVRGVGIAEGLWQHSKMGAAKNGLVEPIHSDVQLPAGRRWAQGMVARSGPKPLGTRRPSRKPTEADQPLF